VGDDRLLTSYDSLLAPASTIFIAYSGGLDSTVLLYACARELPSEKLQALHINHGLSENSDCWQRHCESFCQKLGVSLSSRRVEVAPAGKGVERAAREARYQCFETLLGPDDYLLLAHHSDDQMETIIYRLLRGSGPKGLQGIPVERPLGGGRLLRPLLHYSRRALEDYAQCHQLSWVEDESNSTLRFDRNYLRHEIVPLLATRWPDYRQRILRTASQCESAQAVLEERGRDDLCQLDLRPERIGTSIALGEYFQQLSFDRRKNLLRCWLDIQGLSPCGHSVIESVLVDLVPARVDASPLVSWSGGSFRRFQQRLYMLPPFKADPLTDSMVPVMVEKVVSEEAASEVAGFDEAGLDKSMSLTLPGGFSLSFSLTEGHGALRIRPTDSVNIGFRRGGERCQPSGRHHSAPLKKLLQETGLEPWLRDIVPLIYINGELAAVGDCFICVGFQCGSDEKGYAPVWQIPASDFLTER